MGRFAGTYSDDESLVAALRQGDEAAFAWMLETYDSTFHRVARNYVPTDSIADEVVQDTWIGVIRGIDDFEQRSSLKTWVYRILVNIARSKGVREHRSVPFASLGAELELDDHAVDPDRFQGATDRWPGHWASPPVPWDEEPENRVLGDETLSVVTTAIELLPSNQKMVITLRDVDGWTSDEVCHALDISESNQRVLLHRARSKVRAALELHFEKATR